MTLPLPSSPDFLFTTSSLTNSLDEEGVLDGKLTPNQIRELVAARAGVDVKDTNSKALAEALDEYPAGTYHRFSDKRFLSALD